MAHSSERFESASLLTSEGLAAFKFNAIWQALSRLGDAVIATDVEGRVAALNAIAQRMTGWMSDEAIGKPLESVFRIVDEQTGAELENAVAAVLKVGTLDSLARHTALVTRDGTRIAIEDSAAPIRDDCGKLLGAVVIFHDISERRRTDEALRAADRRKDEFLATLAHELRNPLAPIRQATLISRSPSASEAQKRWSHDVIERQLRNMSLLLDDLLDISRVTRGALALRVQATELAALIDAAVETARPLIDAKRHTLLVQIPPQPVRFGADPLRMAQILSNLLTNAAKYTDPEGQIQLTASVAAEEVVIRVADTGIGIAPEALPSMFEMFAQGPARRGSSTDGGLGIGLALTKGLVELHGGRIEARSDGPGRGSEFTVWLPRRPVAEAQQAAAPAPAPAAKRRVLIADDNRDSAQTLAALLRMEGHEVAVVHDGPQALTAFADFEPEVVLLDVGMPGLNGYEVALRIRRIRPRRAAALVLLIAITGWGQESDRERAFAAGFDHHLTKPVDWQRLTELIRRGPLAQEH
jgi:PAS domain S-box-containing protein